MLPDTSITLIEKKDIEVTEQKRGLHLKLIDPKTKKVLKEITTNRLSQKMSSKQAQGLIRIHQAQDLPYIIEIKTILSASDDEKEYRCEDVSIYDQDTWIKEKLKIIERGKGLLPLHEELNPFHEENIERIKEKITSKVGLIPEDIADMNRIQFDLRNVIEF